MGEVTQPPPGLLLGLELPLNVTTEKQLITLALPATGTVQTKGFFVDKTRILALALQWAGTATGTLSIVGSNDTTDGSNGLWVPIPNAAVPTSPAGSAGSTGVDITTGFRFAAVKYVAVSGTGNLNATGNGKG